MENTTRITGWERLDGAYRILTDGAEIRICFVTEEIVRVRASFDRQFAEESYVLAATAWPDRLDPLFAGERVRLRPAEPLFEAGEETLVFRGAALRLELDREPFCLRLYDAAGSELCRSLPGRSFLRDANLRVSHYSCMREDDCFYGFGEKTGPLNKSMCFLRERATDAMGYDPARADTLYKHIPFYLRLERESGKAVGLFYHNFYESVFNMGLEKSNYWPRYCYWQADGGDIDLFLLGGGTIRRVLDNYTLLTGRPALLPRRALGYQGSSMYYAELEKDSDRAILDFLDVAEEEGFPLDGFHLSSGYTSLGGRRCVFTWNRTRFPDPQGFFAAMNARGVPVVPNVKPGVLLAHPRYEEFRAEGVFIRDGRDAEAPAVGRWWGGPGAFWDFSSPMARRVWKACLRESLLSLGTASVWNDNCEYDGLPDPDARLDFDGRGAPLAALRPLMATLMSRLAAEAVEESDPEARPYIVCRGGSAGIQKYAQTWSGDNRTGWDSLRWNLPTLLGMGLSGQPNEGADIGGFAGPAPDAELLVRWVQNGIFQPRFSIHSANSDNSVTEPWMYREAEPLIRAAILLRYRLRPYLYSAEYEASRCGAPIMRALVYEFQEDPAARDESFEFLFGRDLLVANVLEPGARTRSVYLPAGCAWYDWNDGFRRYAGGQRIEVPVTLETIPLFLREGAVVPLADNQILHMEKDRVTDLRLLLAPGVGEREYTLYDDDGVSTRYRRGEWRKTHIRMCGGRSVSIRFAAEGSYPDEVERVTLELLCPGRAPQRVLLGEDELPRLPSSSRRETAAAGWYYSADRRAVWIRYPNPRREIRLRVDFDARDPVGMEG